jgi:tripartite-type tricarboxylate transporter receptor subunit TctC
LAPSTRSGPSPTPLGPSPSSAINEIVRSPGIQVNLDKISGKPKLGSPQEFAVFMAAQTRKWSEIVKAADIKVE